MKKRVILEIPEVRGKERHRTGKYGNIYTPEATGNHESLIKAIYMSKSKEPLNGYIRAKITCFYKIPKSWSKKKQNQALENKIRPSVKPDLDNISKSILDGLNGVAYQDDKQVTDLLISKYYGLKEKSIVVLEEV